MKNRLISILFFILLFTMTVFGETNYTIRLNGFSYTLVHPVVSQSDTIYLSSDDVSNLTLISLNQSSDTTYILQAGVNKAYVTANSENFTLNNKKTKLSHIPLLQNDILYLPIELLDKLGILYTQKDAVLSFTTPVPYSNYYDLLKDHQWKTSELNLANIPPQITAFSSAEDVKALIGKATTAKNYLAFRDTESISFVTKVLFDRLKNNSYNQAKLMVRKIDTLSSSPTISSFEEVPFSITAYTKLIELKFNNQNIKSNVVWASFLPSYSLTDIDLTQTVDTTLMRNIYEYYRNAYQFKDDKYFSPFTVVSSGNTTALIHDAYTMVDGVEIDYTIKVYCVRSTGSVSFLVDVYQK